MSQSSRIEVARQFHGSGGAAVLLHIDQKPYLLSERETVRLIGRLAKALGPAMGRAVVDELKRGSSELGSNDADSSIGPESWERERDRLVEENERRSVALRQILVRAEPASVIASLAREALSSSPTEER